MAHGRIVIDMERCKGCELCPTACTPKLIVMGEELNKRGYHPAIFVDEGNLCTGCNLCATVCPDGCITVYRFVTPKEEGRYAQRVA